MFFTWSTTAQSYPVAPPLNIGMELFRCPLPRCPLINNMELSLLRALVAPSALGLRGVTPGSGPGTMTGSVDGLGAKLVAVS